MFHTYITTASGYAVDFDRASFLMDKTLLGQALEVRRERRAAQPDDYGAQWVWNDYCRRHEEHYGEGFAPDVTPGWDSSEKAETFLADRR